MRQTSPTGSIDSGFTLLEVLIAMAIVSLAAIGLSLAWPNWVEAGQSRRSVVELKTFISSARESAIRDGNTVSISYDAAAHRLIRSGTAHALSRSTEAKIEDFAGGAQLAFYPDGSSSGGQIIVSTPRQTVRFHIGQLTGALHE